MVNEHQAETERLKKENERLRAWLGRIAEANPSEVYDTPGAICYWAELALSGESI